MLRLTLMLLAAIFVVMTVAGRDPEGEGYARRSSPPPTSAPPISPPPASASSASASSAGAAVEAPATPSGQAPSEQVVAALQPDPEGLLDSPAVAGSRGAGTVGEGGGEVPAPGGAPEEDRLGEDVPGADPPPPREFGSAQEELEAVLAARARDTVPEAEATGSALLQGIEDALAGAAIRYVTGEQVNLRAAPGTDAEVLERLVRGTEVELLADPAGGWAHVHLAALGIQGYMADRYLSPVNPLP